MEQINVRTRLWVTIGVVLAAIAVWYVRGVKLGQDLRGGTNLRFSLDLEAAIRQERITADEKDRVVADTITIIRDRIDKYGLAETTITPLGENRFEIALPAGAEGEAAGIVKVVTQLGSLEFRIEVLPRERYRGGSEEGGAPPRIGADTSPQDWPWSGTAEEFDAYKKAEVEVWKKARLEGVKYQPTRKNLFLVKEMEKEGGSGEEVAREDETAFHVIERSEDARLFTGQILDDPQPSQDEKGMPIVVFGVKTDYQKSFGEWTGRNRFLPMAIVLNELFYTAPTIQSKLTDRVQVTLGTQVRSAAEKEAKQLATVLKTGSLKVRPIKEAENKIGARLAGEARDRGILATIVAFVLVLVFMVVYYRKGGLIANLALLLNLVLLVGVMAFFRATLTLPGIAGIVLTIGMAVDANILINERMFEERRLGRTVRRAISEGYDRAFTTIVDANMTSLITALFLYVYGSGPIKGFAITLAVGLAVSMFTAIYVTRMVYEGAYAKGWIKDIHQLGSAIPPKISWMRLRRIFAPISAIGILFGLFVFFAEDPNTLYDVDFTGGYKLQARFTKPTTVDDVRHALEGEPLKVTVATQTTDEAGNPVLTTKEVTAGPYLGAEVLSIGSASREVEVNVQRGVGKAGLSVDEEGQAFTKYVQARLGDRLEPDWMPSSPAFYKSSGEADPRKDFEGGLSFRLNLVDPDGALDAERLEKVLREDFPYYVSEGGRRVPRKPADVRLDRKVAVAAHEGAVAPVESYDVWWRSTTADGQPAERDPAGLTQALGTWLTDPGFREALVRAGAVEAKNVAKSLTFPSSDAVGSSVAKRLKDDAIVALVLSLLGIIVYVAVRFKSRAMGVSAVLCLFHDVAITLGFVALGNATGLVDAKINLTMVAAFLTLVGYSVNDTVVVFDRIRENRGKKATITAGMIDDSINQTLWRSIKTSVTVFLVCLALFALNVGQRNVLEGFAFCLLIGSVVGSYSTTAIASPLLLFLPWFWQRVKAFAPPSKLVSSVVANPFLIILTPFAALLYVAWWLLFGIVIFAIGIVAFPIWALVAPATEVALT